jgi:hypothetical protein
LSQDPVFVNFGVDRRTAQILSDPQLLNSYSYARGNPLTLKDPRGEIAFFAIPAASVIWGYVAAGFTAMGAIQTIESAHNNLWLPFVQYKNAFTPEQKKEAPIRFGVDSVLNWGSSGLSTEGSVILDSLLWGAEYLPAEEEKERRRGISESRARTEVNIGSGSASPSSRSGGGVTPIYNSPVSPNIFNGYGLSGTQQGALQSVVDIVSAKNFDAQAFVTALRAVVDAFSIK